MFFCIYTCIYIYIDIYVYTFFEHVCNLYKHRNLFIHARQTLHYLHTYMQTYIHAYKLQAPSFMSCELYIHKHALAKHMYVCVCMFLYICTQIRTCTQARECTSRYARLGLCLPAKDVEEQMKNEDLIISEKRERRVCFARTFL
jgi:hypothetical protein